jgi:hypothetical protein
MSNFFLFVRIRLLEYEFNSWNCLFERQSNVLKNKWMFVAGSRINPKAASKRPKSCDNLKRLLGSEGVYGL